MKNNQPVSNRSKKLDRGVNILSTTDRDGVISYVNSDFVAASEFDRSELIGEHHNVVRHPDMPSLAFKMFWEALQHHQPWKGIIKNRCKGGDHYWVDAYVTPIIINDEMVAAQSVRVPPDVEDVKRAEAVYQRINSGRTPSFLKRPRRSLIQKIRALTCISLAVATAVSTIFAGGSAVVVAVVALFCLIGGQQLLLKPLRQAVVDAREVNDDPLARYVYTGRNDEVGQIRLAIKTLRSENRALVGRIADDASNLEAENGGLAEAINQNGAAVEKLFEDTNRVSNAAEQMAHSIGEIAEHTADSNRLAEKVHADAEDSLQTVGQAMQTIETLAHDIAEVAATVGELERELSAINRIVEVIQDIADQTNSIALNASIEAARAGEAGRGFSVVADEVRKLANRSHESSEEILRIVNQYKERTESTVQRINNVQEMAQSGVFEAWQANQKISGIDQSAGQIAEITGQVAAAVSQQSVEVAEISGRMSEIMNAANDLADGCQQTHRSSQQVHELAGNLSRLARQFFNRSEHQAAASGKTEQVAEDKT